MSLMGGILVMKFCTKCGKQIDDDAVFCNYCGAQVLDERAMPQDDSTQNLPPMEQKVANIQSEVVPNINNGIEKIKTYSGMAFSEMVDALKKDRIGQGVYSVATIGRILIVYVVYTFLVYNFADSLSGFMNLVGGRGGNSLPSIPSLTPFYALIVLDFAAIVFLLYKRLKDIGLQRQLVQGISGGYALLAIYAIYSINTSLDKIVSAVFGGMSGNGMAAAKGGFDAIAAIGDISFAFKLIIFLYIVAMILAFIKGTPMDNQHGKKPTLI